MIADLKPYPDPVMKNSGVPWLGEVPEHWEVRRGKWLFRHRKQINSDRSNSNVLSLTLRGVVNNDPDNPEGLVPKDYATYQLFRKGDLVFKLIDLENLRTSRVGLVHEDGIMSSAYVRLTPQKVVDIRFFFQQYFDLYQRGIYNQLGSGVRSTLGPTDLLDLNVVVPPLPEQAAIVRYLDYIDRRIRKYIRAKQKLIKLLEEQKQAVIHRAVTSGLDPNVCLKPSGVEWLGDVPEHWKLVKLHQCVTIAGGMTPSMEVRRYWDGAIPWVTPKDMKRRAICDSITKITDAAIQETSLRLIDPPAILMVVRGMILARKVPIAYTTAQVTINQDMKVLKPIQGVNAQFLACLLDTAQEAFVQLIDEAGHGTRRLPTERWRNITVTMPPEGEQAIIMRFLDETTDTIISAIERSRREVALLHEYRTRLIADVVTGKLDVQKAAARLPDEAGEPELVDEGDAMSAVDEEPVDDLDTVPEEVGA